MGVTTTADEKRDEAIGNLQDAYRNLLECSDNSWGWDDYRDDYQDTILESAIKIKKI